MLATASLALLAIVTCAGASAHANGPWLATIEVVDRADGRPLPQYAKDGQRYVVGEPGHEYTLRVRNLTGERVLAVMSVDGVNVISGETASPDQSGYVIDAFDSVEVAGWRKSLTHTAAFYFTDLGDSYAARTGRPGNVGVIGLAVFRERPRAVSMRPVEKIARADAAAREAENGAMPAPPLASAAPTPGEAPAQAAGSSNLPASPSVVGPARDTAQRAEVPYDGQLAAKRPQLGTGHGRYESSYATRVDFERASRTPAQLVSIRYDRRDNLLAMGVPLPPLYAGRVPQPFPGDMRFAPDPR